jgi:Flp pilus assembly protein CpaB
MASDCWQNRAALAPAIALLALLALSLAPPLAADVLAGSSLQTCVASSDTNITCSKMLVMTLSLDNGQELQTQQLQFSVSCVGRYVPTNSSQLRAAHFKRNFHQTL